MQTETQIKRPAVQNMQEIILLFLVVLIPLFVNFWVEQQFEASKIWLMRTLIAVLGLLCFSRSVFANANFSIKPLPSPIGRLTLAFTAVLALATLLSPYPFTALLGSFGRANGVITQFSYLLLFVIVALQIKQEDVGHLLKAAVLTAAPVCLIGLAQAAGWQPLSVFTDGRSQLVTTLGRANFTAAYLALLLPLTLAAAQFESNKLARFSFSLLLILEVIVIALTQARAGLISAAVGIIVFLWLQLAPHLTQRQRRLGVASGILIFSGSMLFILQRGIAQAGSIAARWTIWKASLELLWPRLWLGYGADTLDQIFPAVYPPELVYYQGRGIITDRAHNWLLDVSLSYGIVATLLFCLLVTVIFRQSWRHFLAQQAFPSDPHNSWTAACIAMICAHLVGNLFLFDVAATALLFWLALAILTATTGSQSRYPIQLQLPAWSRIWVVGFALLIAGWGVWQSNVRPLLADMSGWQATTLFNQGDRPAALERYSAAADQQPFRPEYLVAQGLTAAQLGQFDVAESALLAAVDLRPNDPVLYTHLASVYGQAAFQSTSASQFEQAYAAFEQAISLAPTISVTYQRYADLAIRAGDLPLAQQQAKSAINLDSTDGVSFAILGWTQLQANDLSAAEASFQQAVKWEPNSADFHLALATTFFQQGNLESAQLSVNRSLALNPTYQPALTLRLQLDDQQGDQ
ncbi:MAG: O-antigen ligase family protein [Anaerolineae bacterium]